MGRQKQRTRINRKSNNSREKLKLLIDKLLLLTNADQKLTSVQLHEEITKILNEIEHFDKDFEPKKIDKRCNAAILQQFTKWAEENGAKFESVNIAEFAGYELGLQAKNNIKEGSLVIAVPRKVMMTLEAAKRSILGPLLEKDPILSSMNNVSLALFLLLEKFKGDSFWKSYIDVLPTSYNTVLYLNIEDLRELQASPTKESALKQCKNIVRQYAYLCKLIWNTDDLGCKVLRNHFTFNQYRWAVSTIMTRQNTVPSDDGSQSTIALIPLWDFCNHMNGNISTDYNPTLKRSECFAIKHFSAGEQIFIFYGARSNAELFIHNGFVYEENEHDVYWIKIGLSKSDPLKEKRIYMLKKLALPEQGEFWLKKYSLTINDQLLAFIRIFNMDEELLNQWINNKMPSELKELDCELSASFERKYWRFLLTRLKLIASTYVTTLEEDLKLLNDIHRNNFLLPIKMRITEKQILKSTMDFIENRLKNIED